MAEKILVVDDEQDIVKVLSKILEISGYEVISATNGTDAIALVKNENPELVLLDYMMPDLTGLDVLKEIKKYSDEIYVVMVTGRGSEEVAAAVMKAGASDYVIKPFVKDQIVTVVKDTLRLRQAELRARRLQEELFELNRELENKVTERTRDLVETQDRLIHQQNLVSLGEMSGGMAHEIRNPLNSIALYAQIMQEELSPEDRKREYLDKIMDDIDRINAIVTNLNIFSRRIKRDKEPLHLQGPLEATLRTLSTKFISGNIKVRVDIEPGLPEVLASPEEMEEVFTHLLINSMNAMPQGGDIGVSMRLVRPSANKPGSREYVEISFTDTGIGISKETLDKIFIPFFTTKTDWEGTGLGLSVVDRVITEHEGVIDVESEVGKGTIFKIRLPVLQSGAGLGPLKSAVG
ncbi:MAG TPA: response regulator [Nitrospirota bacterium]|nr:response regulator [Nitrospirota bacterium]